MLVPVKYYDPGYYRDDTPPELKATETRIIQRGYDIRGLRKPRAEEKELLERFAALARKAGQPDAPLLIAISNKAYAGVADQYVVLSEPVEKYFPSSEQDGFIGHELKHREIEKVTGKQYEDFKPAELKVIEPEADAYSFYLVKNAAAIENGLKRMTSFNERAIYKEQPLFYQVCFSHDTKELISKSLEGEQKKHPATDARVSRVEMLERNQEAARRKQAADAAAMQRGAHKVDYRYNARGNLSSGKRTP